MSSTENNNRAASHDFQTALGLLEERLRSLEDSEAIINGLLQGAAEFYGAARASVVEADWDLKIGLLTYEWCAEGVEHQKDMLQYQCRRSQSGNHTGAGVVSAGKVFTNEKGRISRCRELSTLVRISVAEPACCHTRYGSDQRYLPG